MNEALSGEDAGSDQAPDTTVCDTAGVLGGAFILSSSPNKLSITGNVYTLKGTGKCGGFTVTDQIKLTINASSIGIEHLLASTEPGSGTLKGTGTLPRLH